LFRTHYSQYRLSLPSPRAQRLNSSGRSRVAECLPARSRVKEEPDSLTDRREDGEHERKREIGRDSPEWDLPGNWIGILFFTSVREAAMVLQGRTFLSEDRARGYTGWTLFYGWRNTRLHRFKWDGSIWLWNFNLVL